MAVFRSPTMTSRRLALFDLDNTLLSGDSDHAFGEFLIRKQLVDADSHRASNDRFYQDYRNKRLDIHAYVAFTLQPVLAMEADARETLLDEYVREVLTTMVPGRATELVQAHRERGDYCVIITATNSFITAPIAAAFGVDKLLATDLETDGGRFTGRIAGIPCYREGKVEKLLKWLGSDAAPASLSLANSIFYSDSINDLPLLERVSEAVVVNPDEHLDRVAVERGWPALSLS